MRKLKAPHREKMWIPLLSELNVTQVLSRVVPENNDHVGESAVIDCFLQMLSYTQLF